MEVGDQRATTNIQIYGYIFHTSSLSCIFKMPWVLVQMESGGKYSALGTSKEMR